jgi:metal-responsive CopG/Arc/MetJ family transcriptional regulator
MRVTLSLPDYIAKDLKALAKANGTTQSGIVASAIYHYHLENKPTKKKVSGSIALKKAPKRGAKATR